MWTIQLNTFIANSFVILIFLPDNPFGSGTPAQRQKQSQKYRAFRANEAVYEHRMGKLTAQYEAGLANNDYIINSKDKYPPILVVQL